MTMEPGLEHGGDATTAARSRRQPGRPPRSDNTLADFLRASRARLDPTEVGMPRGSRRVNGLRREEVAVLAGVSVDYYARLEQGRERNPSAQVIDAIGHAFKLSEDSRAHMFRLAGLNPRLGPDTPRSQVHRALLDLLDSFPTAAAYVLGPSFDVLATNAPASALLAPFGEHPNMVRVLFTRPQAHDVFREWDKVAAQTVHALRLNSGKFPNDPEITGLIEDMLERSSEFEALWSRHEVGALTRAFKSFDHPAVGLIELTYQTFGVHDMPGQQLLVGIPEPGSRSEEALAFLASIHDQVRHR